MQLLGVGARTQWSALLQSLLIFFLFCDLSTNRWGLVAGLVSVHYRH